MIKTFLMMLLMCMAESGVMSGAGQCEDNHATCTEGDSIRRFLDVLANECASIEPSEGSNEDLGLVMETLKICQ